MKFLEMLKRDKRGISIGELSGLAITFVVIAVVLGVGGTILATIQGDQTVNSTAYNASGKGLTSVKTLADWLPTLATIIASAVVIGVIVGAFAMSRGGQGA